MKPLRLSLCGLNSYKEQQEINFAYLCDGNVFGIFGPTGSGKSTIIDAITLALYGKVERAPSKVQGIVNKNLDWASVTFEFELQGGSGRSVYRVERKYVAKDDTTACRLARLSEVTPEGVVVLADKASHVDARVEEILGLTVDDFTRAVVLPQGRFAEFLGLKGTERREMLERIFNLGDYGERLVSVATTEYRDTESRLKAVQSEQQGLGDAGKQALRKAELAVEEIKQLVADAMEELRQATENRDEARAVRELQQAVQEAKDRLAALELEENNVHGLRTNLDLLSRALSIEPLALSYEEDRLAREASEQRVTTVAGLVEGYRREESEEAQLLEKASRARSEGEPALAEALVELRRATALEERLIELRVVEAEERKALLRLSEEQQQLDAQIADCTLREQSAERSAQTLSLELASAFVALEERQAIERAIICDGEWQQSHRTLSELEKELTSRRLTHTRALETLTAAQLRVDESVRDLREARDELKKLEECSPPEVSQSQREVISTQRVQLEQVRGFMSERERALPRREGLRQRLIKLNLELEALEKGLQHERSQAAEAARGVTLLESELEVARIAHLAQGLRSQLKPSEPCPVCGSLEHPTLGSSPGAEDIASYEQRLKDARAVLQRAIQEIAATETRHLMVSREQVTVMENIKEIDAELRRVDKELEAVLKLFPTGFASLSFGELEQRVISEVKALEQLLTRRSQWMQDLEIARQLERQRLDKAGLANQAQALAEQHVQTLLGEVQSLNQKLCMATTREASARELLEEALDNLGTRDLAARREGVTNKDRKHRELSSALKDLEIRRKAVSETREELLHKSRKNGDLLTVLATRAEGIRGQLEQLEQELQQITGGRAAAEVQTETEERLRFLRDAETALQGRLTGLRQQLTEATKEHVAAAEALRLASDREQKSLLQLEQVLESAGFGSLIAVKALLSEREKADNWRLCIRQHDEAIAIAKSELYRLGSQLGERAVSPLAWEELQLACAQRQEAHDRAHQKRGQLEAELSSLRQRHLRYEELEVERQKLVARRDMLAEIVSLLRGNALVEFMATEHLHSIAGAATLWLRTLTRNRYALEVDPEGSFVVRDDGNGGFRRAVHTLSGGETFVTSLALALALSAQIQLRGKYPLEFFFLDEGFGTLDPDLLETVMSCLERMQGQRMSIGIISHVPELRERIQKKVIVTSAERGGTGSRLLVK